MLHSVGFDKNTEIGVIICYVIGAIGIFKMDGKNACVFSLIWGNKKAVLQPFEK
jgi:hypothetical protein